MHVEQLIKVIKAHIAKGDHAKDKAEQHYISAGQHLKTLKAQHDTNGGNWAGWSELLRSKCDLSTGRASELMQIADGRTSQEKIRAKDKDRKNSPEIRSPPQDILKKTRHPLQDILKKTRHDRPPTPTERLRPIPSLCCGLQPALRKGASSCARAGTRLCKPAIRPAQPNPMVMQARTTGLTSLRKIRKPLTAGSRATHDNATRGTTRKNPWSSGEDP
jgi:hypothetical protein